MVVPEKKHIVFKDELGYVKIKRIAKPKFEAFIVQRENEKHLKISTVIWEDIIEIDNQQKFYKNAEEYIRSYYFISKAGEKV